MAESEQADEVDDEQSSESAAVTADVEGADAELEPLLGVKAEVAEINGWVQAVRLESESREVRKAAQPDEMPEGISELVAFAASACQKNMNH